MKNFLLFLFLCCVSCYGAFAQDFAALNERRLALVIGNANYEGSAKLRNAKNDALKMKETLAEVGFKVIYAENADLKEMQAKVDEFATELQTHNVVLFYYAGHGLQVADVNYLVPVKTSLEELSKGEKFIERNCFRVGEILEAMSAKRSNLNILVLDACRNNPLPSESRAVMAGKQGLAAMSASSGTIVMYATKAGRTASDGDGENGLFTSALIENIKKSEIKLEDCFKSVGQQVFQKSEGMQSPEISSQYYGNFYFKPKDMYLSKDELKAREVAKQRQLEAENQRIKEAEKRKVDSIKRDEDFRKLQEQLANTQNSNNQEAAKAKAEAERLQLQMKMMQAELKAKEEETQKKIAAERERIKVEEKRKADSIRLEEKRVLEIAEKLKDESKRINEQKEKELREAQKKSEEMQQQLQKLKQEAESQKSQSNQTQSQLTEKQRFVDSVARETERLKNIEQQLAQERLKRKEERLRDSIDLAEKSIALAEALAREKQKSEGDAKTKLDSLDKQSQESRSSYNKEVEDYQKMVKDIASENARLQSKLDSMERAAPKKIDMNTLTEEEKIDVLRENQWKDFGTYIDHFETPEFRYEYKIIRNNDELFEVDIIKLILDRDVMERHSAYWSKITVTEQTDKKLKMRIYYSFHTDTGQGDSWRSAPSSYLEADFDLQTKEVNFIPNGEKMMNKKKKGDDIVSKLALTDSNLSTRTALIILTKYFITTYTGAMR
jgi:uncharacterized caspase-like protein